MLITQLVHRTILLSRSSRPENESITSGKREDAHHPSRVASSKTSFFFEISKTSLTLFERLPASSKHFWWFQRVPTHPKT